MTGVPTEGPSTSLTGSNPIERSVWRGSVRILEIVDEPFPAVLIAGVAFALDRLSIFEAGTIAKPAALELVGPGEHVDSFAGFVLRPASSTRTFNPAMLKSAQPTLPSRPTQQ